MSRTLLLACLLHVVVASTYVVSVPAFEGPDEFDHWEYAYLLANSGRLPIMLFTAEELGRPQVDQAGLAHHPPLYYALLAAIFRATGHADMLESQQGNPRQLQPIPAGSFVWMHGADEQAPVSPEIRFFRGVRGLSVAFGVVTLLLVWRLGRLAFPRAPAVADVAVFLLAAMPGWSYNHGVIENDTLAAVFAQATLLALCSAIAAARLDARTALGTALLLALGLMTKLTTLALLPLVLVVALLAVRRASHRGRALLLVALGGVLVLAATGWFFARNLALYGDLLGSAAHERVYAIGLIREGHVLDWVVHGFLPEIFTSMLDLFNPAIVTPQAVLVTLGKVIGACGLLGCLLALLRPRGAANRTVVLVLAGASALVFAATLQFNLRFHQPQARYLYPAIGPMLILFSAGLVRLAAPLPGRLRTALAITGALLATGVALFAAWIHFVPPYTAAVVPAPALHASLTAHCTARAADPGILQQAPPDGARLDAPPTLTWQPLGDPSARYAIYIFSPEGRLYFASHEWLHVHLKGGSYRPDPAIWDSLPRDTELIWNVRRIPDRSKHETVEMMPTGAGAQFLRSG